ncbi:MAG: hypothetical protein ABIY55_30095 [Kofleriaceae bacterium]
MAGLRAHEGNPVGGSQSPQGWIRVRSTLPLDLIRLSLGPRYKPTPYAVVIGTPSESNPKPKVATELIVANPDEFGVIYETDIVSMRGFAAPKAPRSGIPMST